MPYKNDISGIYKIVNLVNGKTYIGSSVTIKRRFATHRNLLNKNMHGNSHLQNAWNKYGSENFLFSIIEELDIDNLEQKEEGYIKEYKDYGFEMYNIRPECSSNRGRKASPETIAKLILSHIGIKQTKETIDKKSKSRYKPIYQIDMNFEIINKFESIKQAANITNLCSRAISLCATNKMKTHPKKGYYWCFVDNYEREIFKNYINEK